LGLAQGGKGSMVLLRLDPQERCTSVHLLI
jgi:hypothetical protein